MERLNNFFTVLNSFDKNLQFTMDIGGKSLNFLDLSISTGIIHWLHLCTVNPPMPIYI